MPDILDFTTLAIEEFHISCGNGEKVKTADAAAIADCIAVLQECRVREHPEKSKEQGAPVEDGFNYRATLFGDTMTISLSPKEVSLMTSDEIRIYDVEKGDQEQLRAMLERIFNLITKVP